MHWIGDVYCLGNCDAIRCLIGHGANPSVKDKQGNTWLSLLWGRYLRDGKYKDFRPILHDLLTYSNFDPLVEDPDVLMKCKSVVDGNTEKEKDSLSP